jgi:hypothetical protein
VGPIAFAAIAVGVAIVLLISIAVMLKLKRGFEQKRLFAQGEEAAKAGQMEAAFRFYRDGYVATFEGDGEAVRTLDNRAMMGRIRELFAGRPEPPGLAALAQATERELIRNPSTRFSSRFRQISSVGRPRSSSRMRSPVREGSTSRAVDPRALLRTFVPVARPYGFFEELTTPELIEEAVKACTRDDLRDIAEVASWRQDDDPILRFVMLELDPNGLRNIDAESLFTTSDLVLMLQELVLLSRGALSGTGAAALLDLASQKTQLSLTVKGKTRVFEVPYRGSKIDQAELVKAFNVLMAEAGSARRYGLLDTKGNDLEIACLAPEQWEGIGKSRFLPILQTP